MNKLSLQSACFFYTKSKMTEHGVWREVKHVLAGVAFDCCQWKVESEET